MDFVLLVILVIGSLVVLVAAIVALRAWLSLARSRRALQSRFGDEVQGLAGRTQKLEARLNTLDARAQELPPRVAHLQENLETLRVLTVALGTTLRQSQNVLSYSGFKTSGTARIADTLRSRFR